VTTEIFKIPVEKTLLGATHSDETTKIVANNEAF
jgi:hypothetical protein